MQWYYTSLGRQIGPVTEEAFQGLVNEGRVKPKTLVWNSRMPDWQQYRKVGSSTPHAAIESAWAEGTPEQTACSECGRGLPQEEMIRYGESWVCAACKPIFVQKLREGVPLAGTIEYAGFWIRFGAKFIDGLIIGVVNIAVIMATAILGHLDSDPSLAFFFVAVGNLLQIAVAAAYTTLFLGRYGATLGKMACNLKVVTADGGRVSYARALGRHFAEFLSAIILLVGYIMAAFDDQKQALHDRICNTRVVKR